MNSSHRLNEPILRWKLSNVLSALAFLHEEAEVIHTDINPSNIMLTVADESVLESAEMAEAENKLPKKVVDNRRTIYSSQKLGLPKDALWGEPVLCDFGEARIGKYHKDLTQPELYRSPGVLFNMEQSSSVDIWSVATLLWDLLENRHLFNAVYENGESSAIQYVAEMVAYLGLPPSEYIHRSETTDKFFDRNDHWKGAGRVVIPPLSLHGAITSLDGESKCLFLDFIRSMLGWLPERERKLLNYSKNPG